MRSGSENSAAAILLWQVPREDLPGVLSQELLEDGGEGDHGLPGAQLGALHHALLVIDEEVGAAGQHRPALLRARLGWALRAEVRHEAVNQLAQVPVSETQTSSTMTAKHALKYTNCRVDAGKPTAG